MNALEIVLGWRPQSFGSQRSSRVHDPIVEPLWSGPRILGAASGGKALLQDVEGERLDGLAALAEALTEAASADELIVDGYVTAEVAHDGTGTYTGGDGLDAANNLLSRTVLVKRPVSDDRRLDEGRAARMPREDDRVALVLVDLLWLDGVSLLDIPLLERRRLLESVIVQSDLVRSGIYVRPPIDTWVGSWRSMGFPGISYKSANSRYTPGAASHEWISAAMPRR